MGVRGCVGVCVGVGVYMRVRMPFPGSLLRILTTKRIIKQAYHNLERGNPGSKSGFRGSLIASVGVCTLAEGADQKLLEAKLTLLSKHRLPHRISTREELG